MSFFTFPLTKFFISYACLSSSNKNMTILITGAAGFIGFHTCLRLLQEGNQVVGIDNFNDYYDTRLKHARVEQLQVFPEFTLYPIDIAQKEGVEALFSEHQFTQVIHLAAQAGVRYSIDNPRAYLESNLDGFFNVLENCRQHNIGRFIYASSSSVYGNSDDSPFSVDQQVDKPISLYAATKKSNELMAHTYSHLYGMQTVGLRFFTVYGPWGRPDMAYFKFANAMREGRSIGVYNHGDLYRDFTYIDDIVEGVLRLASCEDLPPYKVFNIGNHTPVKLLDFIALLEKHLGAEAKKEFLPMQAGDVFSTCADVSELKAAVGFEPSTSLDDGLAKFADWYKTWAN